MERNNTTAGTGKPPQILNADPRIDSPQIKVVYPAQSVVQKDLIIPTEIIAPQVVTPIVTPRVETPTVGTVTNVEKATLTDKDNATHSSFLDCIKQNLSTFLIICALVFALGYLINKNK